MSEERKDIAAAEARKSQLLQLARHSRIKWILNAKETTNERKKKVPSNVSSSVKSQIPIAETIQNTLNYFSDVVEDGELFDVESIAMGLIDFDEFDDEMFDVNKNVDKSNTYSLFINRLLHPVSTELVITMQSFVYDLSFKIRKQRLEATSTAKHGEYHTDIMKSYADQIWKFLETVYEKMRLLQFWKDETDKQFDQSKNDCEKFIMVLLFPYIFNCHPELASVNQKTSDRIEALSFINAEHLEIKALKLMDTSTSVTTASGVRHNQQTPMILPTSAQQQAQQQSYLYKQLEVPINYLKEMEYMKYSMDKLLCIKRASVAISNILMESRKSKHHTKLPGADELLPMMVLTIKFCNPPNLHSNIKYLEYFIHPVKMTGEADYLLTNFIAAVYFLDNVDAQALTIDPEEFERAMRRARLNGEEHKKDLAIRIAPLPHKRSPRHGLNRLGTPGSRERSQSVDSLTDVNNTEAVDVQQLFNDFDEDLKASSRKQYVSIREIYQKKSGAL